MIECRLKKMPDGTYQVTVTRDGQITVKHCTFLEDAVKYMDEARRGN